MLLLPVCVLVFDWDQQLLQEVQLHLAAEPQTLRHCMCVYPCAHTHTQTQARRLGSLCRRSCCVTHIEYDTIIVCSSPLLQVARDHTGPPQRLPFSQLRQLQVDHPVHICPSERESFGHYINEARAAAAVVITVDHPPMNELVSPKAGVLVNPQKLLSYQEMALGTYGPITAKIDSSKLCEAVETVLAMLAEVSADSNVKSKVLWALMFLVMGGKGRAPSSVDSELLVWRKVMNGSGYGRPHSSAHNMAAMVEGAPTRTCWQAPVALLLSNCVCLQP